MTSFLSNVVIHRKEVIYYISPHAGTAEPLRVSPPEAVDYVIDLLVTSWRQVTIPYLHTPGHRITHRTGR